MARKNRKQPGDILDDVTGLVRVLDEKCITCVFRSGNPMHLEPGYLQGIIRDNVGAGALLTCHKTLPYGDHPEFGPAACHGFWESHGKHTTAGIIAENFIGITYIKPPKEHDEQVQAGREAEPTADRHEPEAGQARPQDG
jgi:hypothetical protein